MNRQCRYCGFKNPSDIGDCLNCGRDLPTTVGEVKEAFKTLGNMAEGKWGQVGQKVGEDIVVNQVSSLKYRFHPVWFIKVKLHRIKKALISIFWVFGIIIILVILGLIYKALGGK